ncbi:hypothetical protein BMS3Abin03_00160 [bacterium BMS3Abin03]|nr:hypothetical protein BMS3Abin03_00160 [bacterium BMS3Abin03]
MKHQLFIILFLVSSQFIFGTDPDTLRIKNDDLKINAHRITEPVKIDGKLDESLWDGIEGISSFIQLTPDEGAAPTQKTEVKVAYDDDAIYIAARMYDTSPDSIISRLSRRDVWLNSDEFAVGFDPYHDKRSGYFFGVNSAGTLIDGVLFNDTGFDDSWDGVWEGSANIDSIGWTVEMRIPFSQMKFYASGPNIWGINFRRNIARNNEEDFLVFIPKTESSFVSHFAELVGMSDISPPLQIELLPYITGKAEYIKPDDGNPFNDGSNYLPGAGLDLKMGIGSGLTLNGTINPDFGQVEIDPAVINLTDIETFFPEKRPFFIEGSSIFNFGKGGATNYWGFNWSNPQFFYSRRIGREPQGSVPSSDYVDYPEGTHILGAAKLTGKIGGSWNFGTVQSLTKREFARIQNNGVQSNAEVEPLAYYGVIRTEKEFDEGSQGLGILSTLALRDFKDQRLKDQFNASSLSVGLDGWTFLDSSRTWVLAGWTGMSRLTGNNQRLIDLQKSSRHYFQRPDASQVAVDSNATSLTGFAGRFVLNKQKGNFFVNSAFGFITPSFDVNDLGFFYRSDVINMHVGARYNWTIPTSFYRQLILMLATFRSYDFGGNITSEGLFHYGGYEFLNYYNLNWNLGFSPETMNSTRTRGGPLTLNPSQLYGSIFLRTDNRNDWILNFYTNMFQNGFSEFWSFGFGIEIRPAPNISISFDPGLENNHDYSQYIGAYDDPLATETFGKRYVFGELNQKTYSASIRLNWTFSPTLSLQLYVQPLISTGKYVKYKELKTPGTYDFINYGEDGSTFDDENYIADPDGDGPAPEISIGNNDFNFISLRGNAVLRWEYLPGSVIFFVWTQSRADVEGSGDIGFGKSINNLVDLTPDNIFMVKFTYWFSM